MPFLQSCEALPLVRYVRPFNQSGMPGPVGVCCTCVWTWPEADVMVIVLVLLETIDSWLWPVYWSVSAE